MPMSDALVIIAGLCLAGLGMLIAMLGALLVICATR